MIALLLFVAAALGAVQLQLRAEPAVLVQGQVGTVRMTVISGGNRDPWVASRRPPVLPVGRGLSATYVGQAPSFQNFNGRITRIIQFEYRLAAVDPGTWSVGPAEVQLEDGSALHSEPIQVTVRERPAGGAQAPTDEPFTIDVGFDHEELWEGQVAVFHARFESRAPGAQARWRLPEFQGLRPPQSGSANTARYVVDDPAGRISVSEETVPLVAVATGQRDQGVVIADVGLPIGQDLFGLQRNRVEQWTSGRLSVNIRPLPTPPPDFSGLVGDFEVKSEVSAGRTSQNGKVLKVAVGQSLPWTVVISGPGSLEGFELPPYEAPGVSVYENSSRVFGQVDGDGFHGSASFSRVLVPTAPGRMKLPETRLVLFSPTKGKYVTRTLSMPELEVVGSVDATAAIEVYGEQSAPVADETPVVALRPPYTWGGSTAPSLAPVLPVLLGLGAAPGVSVLGGSALASWVRRRRERRAASAGVRTATELVASLPADPEARLGALDQVLRRLEAQGAAPDAVRALRFRLGKVRFGAGERDPDLETEIKRLVREIEA